MLDGSFPDVGGFQFFPGVNVAEQLNVVARIKSCICYHPNRNPEEEINLCNCFIGNISTFML